MGVQALGLGLGTLIREMGVQARDRHRPRLPLLFGLDQAGADHRPDGGGLQGARHRAGAVADGLFRPVRSRRAVRRHGDGLPQRQRLDRREDGRQPAAHLRPRRDDAAQGDRARRQVRASTGGGSYVFVENFRRATSPISPSGRSSSAGSRWWRPAATARRARSRRSVLEAIGCEVVPLDCELDYTFPQYNPNPEDMKMLHAMRDEVLAHKADVGLGFDGDGDRCGVVDDKGEEIFADKVGVMLARDMSTLHPGATFVVDVKSTGLFVTDPVLQQERREGRLLEDRPLLHEAAHPRARRARRVREVRPLLLQYAVRPRLRRRLRRGARGLRHARPQSRKDDVGAQGRAAQDLGLADHVAALRRRGEVRHRRAGGEALRGRASTRARRSPASRSATSSPSTACA